MERNTLAEINIVEEEIPLIYHRNLHAGVKVWFPNSGSQVLGPNSSTQGVQQERSISWREVPVEFRIVATHGWLDNAATFNEIAPSLASKGFCVLAIDLPGHGKSSHFNRESCGMLTYSYQNYVFFLLDTLESIKWLHSPSGSKLDSQSSEFGFHLMGHSLGGNICFLIAGMLPDIVLSLFSIEAVSPLVFNPDRSPQRMMETFSAYKALSTKTPKLYKSMSEAAQARVDTISKFYNNTQKINFRSCFHLVERGTVSVERNGVFGVMFSHDTLLHLRTPISLSEEDVKAFHQRIACPVLVILGKDGLGKFWKKIITTRLSLVSNLQVEYVEGYHHVHLDDPSTLIGRMCFFFEKEKKSSL